MNAAVIKVAFANPPKEGKKLASIKADDGQLYGVWPDKFGLFRPGRSYRVEFSTRKWQGQDYHTITKCQPIDDEAKAPQGNAAPAVDGELSFVTAAFCAKINSGLVGNDLGHMVEYVRLLRQVYQQGFKN